MHDAFYLPDGDGFAATPMTRGPWDNRAQHGGPPAALLTHHMARFGDDASAFALARVDFELLRPVPIGRMVVRVRMDRAGRAVQRLAAVLEADGREVMTARGLRIRRTPLDLPPPPAPPAWPEPASLDRYEFSFFQHDVGYHKAVDLRLVHGAWGRTPIGFWGRPVVDLIAGLRGDPLVRAVILADAQSGMGVPLDPRAYTFVNPDMTLYAERPPVGEWVGLDIRSAAGPLGAGLAESQLRDGAGVFGRSAQSLVVAPR